MADSAIILFGQKIGFPETPLQQEEKKDGSSSSDRLFTQGRDETDDNPKTPSINDEIMSGNPQSTDGLLQTTTVKKPDKILPCPRCDSMNTKFCYFNNSNVNQPRHFCKSCQRYWTAGGTMRNMPVGAGRRKKKAPPVNCRYVISQEALESAAVNHIEFGSDSDGKVLSFGQKPKPPSNGCNLSGKENKKDYCCYNSGAEEMQDKNGFHSQVHWIPGGSWPYNPWNTPIPVQIGYPPIPMYPSPYWGSVSWVHPAGSVLGKHASDKPNGSNEESKKQKSTVLIPKTLRIDDPDEAAKSSIWATLGIKNEHSGRGDLFGAFQSKGNGKTKTATPEPSPVLQANPAAFSRSVCFQESA